RSYTTAADWAYPRVEATTVRAAAEPNAPPIGTLGLSLVRLLGYERSDDGPNPGLRFWARVVLPDAKQGFVAPGSLLTLSPLRFCYAKNLLNPWQITGFISGGNCPVPPAASQLRRNLAYHSAIGFTKGDDRCAFAVWLPLPSLSLSRWQPRQ